MNGTYDDDLLLLETAAKAGEPGVDVYRYPSTAVVIGRGGKVELELRPEMMAADGVPLLRRRGGGCAVVLDPGNLVLSLALPLPGVGGITSAFDGISAWLVELLTDLGLPDIGTRGVSDLTLGERKIGGSCIYRTKDLLYYSTTLMVAPRIELLDRYLKHPPREPEYRRGRAHAEFVTSLEREGLPADPAVWRDRLHAAATGRLDTLFGELAGTEAVAAG